MPLALLYPALAFLLAIALVFGAAGLALWRYRRTRTFTRWGRVAVTLAAVGLACLAEGTWVEPNWPEVTHTTLVTPHLPPKGHVRIVQLSDLHSEAEPRLEPLLPALVAAQHPDLIAFTGDAANDATGRPTFRHLMAALAKVAPTFAVKGNWDVEAPSEELFGATGVVELVGRPVTLTIHGAPVTLNGSPFTFGAGAARALEAMPGQGLRVFLYHTPDEIDLAPGLADVYLAGHTHGGQVRLPFYGAVVTMSVFGKQYEAGPYEVGGTRLYVNRGIGMEGHFPLKARFLCRPEVAVIDLVAS
ncbi:MAG: phosphodiesterase YaeI [Cyanobacteria bacterium RYN_339]|nr:phosphodiesterase YaeI [Cyanobacteria bacterium RYN_339]